MIMAHDAATGYLPDNGDLVYAWAQTQQPSSTAFTTQLNCGVRVFDLRLEVHDGALRFHHGPVHIPHKAKAAFQEVMSWANQNANAEELVLLIVADCSGSSCQEALQQTLSELSIQSVGDCRQIAQLTLGSAAALGRLPGGGHVLAVTSCVDMHYDPSLACSGLDGPSGQGQSTLRNQVESCAARPRQCAEELRTEILEQDRSGRTDLGYYSCWEGSSGRDYALNRLLNSLRAEASQPYGGGVNGHLWQLQALWQETTASVVIGTVHGSSLLKDETKSGLNEAILAEVRSGNFKHINFLELNNVCDHGPGIFQALRQRVAKQSSDISEPVDTLEVLA